MVSWDRRGLDLLLEEYPQAQVEQVTGKPPWTTVDLVLDGSLQPFAVWQETGCVYTVNGMGEAMPPPVLVPPGSPYVGVVGSVMPTVSSFEHVAENEAANTFTYFLPDGLLTVPSDAVVTTFMRARAVVDVWLGDAASHWSSGEGWDAMYALEASAYPERAPTALDLSESFEEPDEPGALSLFDQERHIRECRRALVFERRKVEVMRRELRRRTAEMLDTFSRLRHRSASQIDPG